MKRLLIISPYFPPSNAADMQRVRMSLPYYKQFGWDAEVVIVDQCYSDMPKDELLMQSLPADIKIHQVKALNKKWTSKAGLGSLALRSFWFLRQKVDRLLKETQYDLIFFSTTQFPVCVLGAYWKKRFGIPYVIDMQDPWHSDYYQDKPPHQRPPKYWFSYQLNKYLEPIAMKAVSGLISVSAAYIDILKTRYPEIKAIPSAVITFGYFAPDMAIAAANSSAFKNLLDPDCKNMVYVGRGGADMHQAIIPLFDVFKQAKGAFKWLKLYFIGTSYAPNGKGQYTILPLARQYGMADRVMEVTNRIGYYHTLATLQRADALFIPGSDDPAYTASKLYPYLLANKPLLGIFNPDSPALAVLDQCGVKNAYSYNAGQHLAVQIHDFCISLLNGQPLMPDYNKQALKEYSSENLTAKQCGLFNAAIEHSKRN